MRPPNWIRAAAGVLGAVLAVAGCGGTPAAGNPPPSGTVHNAPMTRILPQGESLLLRTDFTDDTAWERTLAAVTASYPEDTVTGLTPVDDTAFDGLTLEELADLIEDQYYVFLADTMALTDPEHPVLAVDTSGEDGVGEHYPTFRVAADQIGSVEVNLFLANMDFYEFADSADEDGVYRGFDQ